MKIIIVGAGRIGRNLAKSLSAEYNEVYLIEQKETVARMASEKLDVKVVVGNAVDPDTLVKAGITEADLVMAVTTSDETNLVVCSLAAMFGAKRRIARVRNIALSAKLAESGYNQFSVDDVINPELLAAQAIVKTIYTPGAHGAADFADGKILLRAFDITEHSSLCGIPIGELRDDDFPWPFLIVSVIRNDEVIIPKGDTTIQAGDHIYVLLPASSLAEFVTFIDTNTTMPKKVVIYGASITGKHVAIALSGQIKDVIVLEEDPVLATELAGELNHVRIINGSPSETEILTECGIEVADVFIAASNNDHINLISSVLAKKLGAKTTIIMTQQPDYMSIVNALDIDAIINPHYLAVEQILHLVRGKGISSVAKLLECNAEALEFIPEEGSPVTRAPIKEIKFPKNSIVGAVYSGNRVELADGETVIRPDDRVIVFCQDSAVKKLQQLFTRRKLL